MIEATTDLLRRGIERDPSERTTVYALIDHLEGERGLDHARAVRQAVACRRDARRLRLLGEAEALLRPRSGYRVALLQAVRDHLNLAAEVAVHVRVVWQRVRVFHAASNHFDRGSLNYWDTVLVSPRQVLQWRDWIDAFRESYPRDKDDDSTWLSLSRRRRGGQHDPAA